MKWMDGYSRTGGVKIYYAVLVSKEGHFLSEPDNIKIHQKWYKIKISVIAFKISQSYCISARTCKYSLVRLPYNYPNPPFLFYHQPHPLLPIYRFFTTTSYNHHYGRIRSIPRRQRPLRRRFRTLYRTNRNSRNYTQSSSIQISSSTTPCPRLRNLQYPSPPSL